MGIIYKITNIINGKIYIGSSKTIDRRFYEHLMKLRGSYHINKHLQSAFDKYGEEAFKFEIIREVSLSILRRAEQFYINKYNSLDPKFGYNKAVVVSNFADKTIKEDKRKNTVYFGAYKEGKLFKVFRDNHEIMRYFNTRSISLIYEVAGFPGRTAFKYHWIRVDVSKKQFPKTIKITKRKGRNRTIIQSTLEGDFVASWGSIIEAATTLKICQFGLVRCLSNTNQYKGFKWNYA